MPIQKTFECEEYTFTIEGEKIVVKKFGEHLYEMPIKRFLQKNMFSPIHKKAQEWLRQDTFPKDF